jgi:hypothetical protein
VWGGMGWDAHMIGKSSVLDDHGQMEDASHRCDAVGQCHNLPCLLEVSNIQCADLNLHPRKRLQLVEKIASDAITCKAESGRCRVQLHSHC